MLNMLSMTFAPSPGVAITITRGLNLILARDEETLTATSRQIGMTATSDGVSHFIPHDVVREGNQDSGEAWLNDVSGRYATWNADLAEDLIDEFGLEEHICKPLYMFSLGSARKLNLVAAFAAGADVNVFEQPFAALDGPSRQLLAEILLESSDHPQRAFIVADFTQPAWMRDAHLASRHEI